MPKQSASLLILNGKSAGNGELRQAVNYYRQEGYPLFVRVTWEHGDAQRYVAEAVERGVATVIAGGGDGTINEVAGKPVPIDIAQVNNDRFFINMATGGFGTRITTETPEKLKSALGGASYFIHGLLRMDTLKADSCEIRRPGFHWQGDALVIGIGNGRLAGGGQALCPGALINDGRLQLRIIASEEWLPTLINSLSNGDDQPQSLSASLSWLQVDAPNEIIFNLDGEPLRGRQFHITVIPAALTCRLPPQCPLLA
ncbi:lipid kinase YegS [Candidatus Sodalis sp. SoCistrobi]|uniref:lipid kinase YegS n=1 Tax=Candidatus Sodalis sp. SoCistrobi TaxID=1922216 RepID=UPI00352F8B23